MNDAPDSQARRLFSSGRLCLFGEHTDWAATYGQHPGYCLVIGTDQGIAATARPDDKFSVESLVPDSRGRATGRTRQMSCPFDPADLLAAAEDDQEFFRYCAGTALAMSKHPQVTGGLNVRIDRMDLPLAKGVSSSAAVCILIAEAFNQVYSLGLFPHELMDAAYRGETMTGSQCGRMDQACIYGKIPVLLDFVRDTRPRVEPVNAGGTFRMFFVDLAGKKDTVTILNDLRSAYPRSTELQEALGSDNEGIVRQACRVLSIGDAEAFGKLMTAAQQVFDRKVAPHSPDQLASPLLHELLGWDELKGLIWGGKGVGSQGDGTAQFVARSQADRDRAMKLITEKHPEMQCFAMTIAPSACGAESPQ
ncbi:MAG: GHMP kinase [Phycisphaerae bacterium]